jgi:hypothetical protein
MDTYRIKHWNKYFMNAEGLRKENMVMSWVRVPNKHDGKSYRRLLRNPEHVKIFCAWVLIVQVASKQTPKGTLADIDGALTPEDLSDSTGFPEEIFELAFEALSDPKIGWLEVVQ